MDSFTLVIFGVTGNLSQIKLIPTLYDLIAADAINIPFSVLGIGRRDWDAAQFRSFVSEVLRRPNRHHTHTIDEKIEKKLLSLIHYHPMDAQNPDMYESLKNKIGGLPGHENRMYYLATLPNLYEPIFRNLATVGLNSQDEGWVRIMLEKPIGHDRGSAVQLNKDLLDYYTESQIYRLDHYLGKETMQNILTFRFGNGIFEPLMNNKYIDHIQVTALEDFGIGERGEYYDGSGALRDVGQNHMLQMLALATMDRPDEFTNSAITAERVKLLQSLKPDTKNAVFGQCESYTGEPHISPDSETETFFAVRTQIENDRYRGVPIYMRAGKYLASTVTEIAIVFKNSPERILKHLETGLDPNILIYRITPNEGIVLKMLTKVPGHELKLQESYMQYCYRTVPGDLPDAYERLIIDALKGDQTFFNDAPEIVAQWEFADPVIAAKPAVGLHTYSRGSWGPAAADELIKSGRREWIEPSALFCAI